MNSSWKTYSEPNMYLFCRPNIVDGKPAVSGNGFALPLINFLNRLTNVLTYAASGAKPEISLKPSRSIWRASASNKSRIIGRTKAHKLVPTTIDPAFKSLIIHHHEQQ